MTQPLSRDPSLAACARGGVTPEWAVLLAGAAAIAISATTAVGETVVLLIIDFFSAAGA